MNLSEHFTLAEATFSSTAVRLELDNAAPLEVVDALRQSALGLEKVRHELGDLPIYIDSWYRCSALNRAVNGATFSAHLFGWAIDFICPDAGQPFQIVNQLTRTTHLQFDQLIQEGSWVHISFDPRARRQILTAHFGPHGTTYS